MSVWNRIGHVEAAAQYKPDVSMNSDRQCQGSRTIETWISAGCEKVEGHPDSKVKAVEQYTIGSAMSR